MPVCKAEAHRALELLEDYYRFVFFFTSIVILCMCVRITTGLCLFSEGSVVQNLCVCCLCAYTKYLFLSLPLSVCLCSYISLVIWGCSCIHTCPLSHVRYLFQPPKKSFFVKRNKSDNLRLNQLRYS